MIEVSDCLRSASKIIKLQKLNSTLIAIATQSDGIKIFSTYDCEIKASICSKFLNEQVQELCFSYDSKYLAFANKNIIYIIDVLTHKLINNIHLENENIDIMCFSYDSKYLLVGSSRGRVLQYKYNDNLLISKLCSFPYNKTLRADIKNNFVSAIAIYNDKVAVSGYGGYIYILDMFSLANKSVIKDEATRIDALCFINNDILISGNNQGTINIISLKTNNILKKIVTPFSKIKQIVLMPNPNFILISAETNYTIVIDITTYKIVHKKYLILNQKIKNILLLENSTLLISLENLKVLKIKLPNVLKLKQLIYDKSYAKAFKLIENEPMLQNTNEHKELEDLYSTNYEKAIDALKTYNKPQADKFMQEFKDVVSKKDEVFLLFRAFDNYNKFKELFSQKKYPLVHTMSEKYPALKYTKEYILSQEIWKKTFIKAQKEILLGNIQSAKELLNPYITVKSKSVSVKLILNHNKDFLEFLQAIEKKEYKKVFSLVKQNKDFSEIPTFISLKEEINDSIISIRKDIDNSDIDIAKLKINKIQNIIYISQEVEKLKHTCEMLQELIQTYKDKNFLKCYEILDSNSELSNTKLTKLLEQKWSDAISLCEEFALNGNIIDIKNTLGELINLESRKEKIANLLKISFYKRVNILVDKKLFEEAKNIIYSYIDIFSLDYEIQNIIKEFEKITNTQLTFPMKDFNSSVL